MFHVGRDSGRGRHRHRDCPAAVAGGDAGGDDGHPGTHCHSADGVFFPGRGPRGAEVEGVQARRAEGPEQAADLLKEGVIPVLADPEGSCIPVLKPDAVVDAILAKKNLGTKITDAPVVVGVGPGFTAGVDCHAVVETMRGHTLGRVYHQGSALPNTGIPGLIGGFAGERVLRAPADGVFHQLLDIGAQVKMGDVAATVDGEPMICTLDGVLRGILPEGTPVHKGMKAGDIDPRCAVEHCYTASDKALAVGGGVLEAILHLSGALRHPLVPAEPALYDRLEQQPFLEAWDACTLETLF